MERVDEQPSGAPGPAAVLTGGAVDGSTPDLVACSNCGLPNAGYAGYCGNCLAALDG
jgi:hypothetical protein